MWTSFMDIWTAPCLAKDLTENCDLSHSVGHSAGSRQLYRVQKAPWPQGLDHLYCFENNNQLTATDWCTTAEPGRPWRTGRTPRYARRSPASIPLLQYTPPPTAATSRAHPAPGRGRRRPTPIPIRRSPTRIAATAATVDVSFGVSAAPVLLFQAPEFGEDRLALKLEAMRGAAHVEKVFARLATRRVVDEPAFGKPIGDDLKLLLLVRGKKKL